MEKKENFSTELENQYSILIEANEKNKHRRYIFLVILLGITFISVLISIFFSYKAFKNSNDLNKQSQENNETYYQTLSVVYNNTNELAIDNIDNGYTLANPKIIQITNEGNTDITFNIKIASIKTTLISTNNLVYTLTKNNELISDNTLPLQEKNIVSEIKIKPEETITYIINVSFTGILEEGNNTNSYHANIIVEQANNKTNLLE